MTNILFLIGGIVLGFLIRDKTLKNFKSMSKNEMKEMREEAQGALDERTEKRKGKILDFMKNESIHQKEIAVCNPIDEKNKINIENQKRIGVTSEDIAELLEVSKQTARKYLNNLEDEGKVNQIGDEGQIAYYILKEEPL